MPCRILFRPEFSPLYVFDLPVLLGRDLRGQPFEQRRTKLEASVFPLGPSQSAPRRFYLGR